MSFDNKPITDHMQGQSEAQTTTNGAPAAGMNDIVDVVNSECVGWIVEMASSGGLQFASLDRLVHVGREASFPVVFEAALRRLDIPEHVCKAMVQYVCAKASPLKDYSLIVEAVKSLVNDPTSPLCVRNQTPSRGGMSGALGLPTPCAFMAPTVDSVSEVHHEAREPLRIRVNDRTAATKRASQVISQYKLTQFDSCIHPHEYLEWKYSLLDVIDMTEDDDFVKLEVLLQCLSPQTSSEVRLNLTKEYSSVGAAKLFEITLNYLDSCYKNLRSIRHIESTYLNCKMQHNEALPLFLARFHRCARLYERARDAKLSDNDRIVSFGNAIAPQYRTIATLVETMTDSMDFTNYTQRLIYLADAAKVTASLNLVETAEINSISENRKRFRQNEKGDAGVVRGPVKKGGCVCFRCQQSGHISLFCTNSVKDLERRCGRCGSTKHKLGECRAALTSMCRRCGGKHAESVCPVDIAPSVKPKAPIQANAVSQFDELQRAMEAGNAVIECDVGNIVVECDCNAVGLVDTTPPMLRVAVGRASSGRDGLLDSGAAANFIHPDEVLNLFREQSIDKGDIVQLQNPITIRFGNGHIGRSDTVLKTTVHWDDTSLPCSFIVYPGLTPSVILGRPFLNSSDMWGLSKNIVKRDARAEMNQIECVKGDQIRQKKQFAWVHEGKIMEGSRKFLTIHFPLLETTVIEPIREPLRSMSAVTERILLTRLLAMEEEGSVSRCPLESLRVVVPPVLVDKKTGTRRTFPDHELHNRYRVTLDLRGFNKLRLYNQDNQFALIGETLDSIQKNEVRQGSDQFQHSSFEILKHIPTDQLGCFSKIDIRNAYNSVRLPPSLCLVGTEVYDSDAGRHCHFRFNTLVQGWKYSPCFFRMVADYLTQRCRERFSEDMLRKIYIAFYQDDILLTSDPEYKALLVEATALVLEVLESYSFTIRRDKVETAVDALDFCGYRLIGKTSKPNPSRKKFSAELATKLWTELHTSFDKGHTAVTKWVRSVAGMFQYCYGHLGPKQLTSLRRLYLLVSNSTDAELVTIAEYEEPFTDLINFCCNGLPNFFLGAFMPAGKPTYSVIVCDANQESWAGMLIKVVAEQSESCSGQLPGADAGVFKPLIEILKTRSGSEFFTIYPVRLFGAKFSKTTTRQSSTYRERAAMLECVYESYPLLEGEVLAVCDNKNCQQQWHDIECFGALLGRFARFQEVVSDILWISRDELPSIADMVARMINVDLPPVIQVNAAHFEAEPADLRGEILRGYRQDNRTEYLGVRLCDIYAKKLEGSVEITEGADAITKATKFFEIDGDGYFWFISGSSVRLYVPEICSENIDGGDRGIRLALIFRAHCMNNIHVGIYRTLCNCDKYWWPGLQKDVRSMIGSCWPCISSKTRLIRSHQSTVQSSTSSGAIRPFQTWHVDHLGPLQIAGTAKYALVCVCSFSHFLHCVPVERVDALTTAFELFKLFTTFGLPTSVHSDQGSAFKNELEKQLSELLSYNRQFSPVAFPRSNGLAEQTVGVIKSMLTTMNANDLQASLPLICLMHNSMPTNRVSTTALVDLCPFEAAFGFRPRTASEMDLAMLTTQPFTAEIQYFVRRLFRSALTESLQHVDNESLLATRIVGFQPGDLVVVIRKSGIQPTRVDGPYVLLNRIGSNIWRMFRLEEGLMVSVMEAPEAILKRFEISPAVEGFPIKPPIPGRNPTVLKRHDYIIIKNTQADVPTVSLYQVLSNDHAAAKVTARLMRPNQLMEFYATDRHAIIPYDDIVLSNFKLSNRLLSEPIQHIVFSLLGEGL